MIDVGLVGFGFAGKTFHAPIIRAVEGLRLAAILQRTGAEAQLAHPDVQIVRSLDEMLAQPNIGLIVLATPNPTHFPLAQRCLQAGRHVVIDKPFTTTCAEAAELTATAASEGRILSVYHNRRWDGDFLTVQKLLADTRLGRPVLFESHFDRFRPQSKSGAWREQALPGSGVLFDLGPHLIDQALTLFGLPEAISADVRIEREDAVIDDAFDVVLHYPKLRARLRAGMLVSTPTPRFVIQGTEGGYLKYGLDPQEEALKRGDLPSGEFWGYEPPSKWGTLLTRQGDSFVTEPLATLPGDYRQYYRNVRDAILGEAPLAVPPQEALLVMRALELAVEGSQTGRVVPWRS